MGQLLLGDDDRSGLWTRLDPPAGRTPHVPTKTEPSKAVAKTASRKKAAPPALFTPPAAVIEQEVVPAVPRKTTRLIDGKAVVGEETVDSPLPTRDKDGNPVKFSSFTKLLLEDGSWVYGCKLCLFTATVIGHMTSHRQREHPRPDNKPGAKRKKVQSTPDGYTGMDIHDEVLGMNFFEVIEAVGLYHQFGEIAVGLQGEVERLTAELAAETAIRVDAERRAERLAVYRDRALAAETDLRKIQTALSRAGFHLKVDDDE